MRASPAWRFIFFIGMVSLFADITYEGGRGLSGPFLYSLGASATAVGFISGFGEMVGYGFRLLSGWVSERTGRYWAVTIAGFAINLAAIPLLAFAGTWPVAAGLLVAERLGKSIRAPAKDTLISHAGSAVGFGRGFGFQKAMDQLGAVIGPFIGVFTVAAWGYRGAFGVLIIPAVVAMALLLLARRVFPDPSRFETDSGPVTGDGKLPRALPRTFWIYLIGAGFLALGYADFTLLAFHFMKKGIMTGAQVPLAYAVAMAIDAVAAMAFGLLFDRHGFKSLPPVALMAAIGIPLAFSGQAAYCWIGIILWAATLGAQDSCLKAGIARLVPKERRAGAYGIFHAAFGVSWFVGSAAMGWLYDHDLRGVITLAISAQILSLIAFVAAGYSHRRTRLRLA